MNNKYLKNRNTKRSYTLEELISEEPIFENDLIWKNGFTDWTYAGEIDELKEYVLQTPPSTKSIIFLKSLYNSLRPSIIIFLIFSVLIGTSAALIEKHQYNGFMEKIQPNIDEALKKEEEFRNAKLRYEEEQERERVRKEKLKTYSRQKFEQKEKELKLLQEQAFSQYKYESNPDQKLYYYNLADDYLKQREKNLQSYQYQQRVNSNESLDLTMSKSDGLVSVSYDVPSNTIYASDGNGNRYTRWNVYAGVGNHEQISYENNYKFLFRPYKAFFSVVNLSNEEVENSFLLWWNFLLSALLTNLIFYPILIFGVMRYQKR